MIIKPRVRGFICTNAHPAGCAANVTAQIKQMQAGGALAKPPKNVLILGSSGGYGLPSRICAAFAGGAATLGIGFEREPSEKKTASAGWYNSLAFDAAAKAAGLWSQTLNIDAFSDAAKEQVIRIAKEKMGPIDLVVYSLAAPVRKDPATGALWRSVIKPIGANCQVKSLNVDKAQIIDAMNLEPASEEEIDATVKVMGGEDWRRWLKALGDAAVLSDNCRTLAYTYIGSELTWPIYKQGTIGRAKEDLDLAAAAIRKQLQPKGGDARIIVLKAVVTQASAAIPVVPLYISILFRIMKNLNIHEDCASHIDRLFRTQLGGEQDVRLDDLGRIRMDEMELSVNVQSEVQRLWPQISTENLRAETDFDGFREDFLKIFGFGVPGVDYAADISPLWQPGG